MTKIETHDLPFAIRQDLRGAAVVQSRMKQSKTKELAGRRYYVTVRGTNETFVYEFVNGKWVNTRSY